MDGTKELTLLIYFIKMTSKHDKCHLTSVIHMLHKAYRNSSTYLRINLKCKNLRNNITMLFSYFDWSLVFSEAELE